MTTATSAVRRVGHKGADLIEPGNTLASFDAALAAGVDMIEFDVLPANEDGSGELVLAHDYRHVDGAPTLVEGLAHLAGDAFAGVDLDVDMKLAGYEDRVIAALREHGLAERTLISTMEEESLPRIRAGAPEVRLGWSVPKVRRDYLANPLTRPLARGAVRIGRATVARRAAQRMRAGTIDALMSHWALVTPAFAATIKRGGGELYVWTVDDAEQIATLREIDGVTGIITNDPRLFGAT